MSDIPGIHAALAEAQGRIGGLAKTEKNKEQGFMFRSIDAIVTAAKPVFADLGISVTPRLLRKEYEQVQSAKGSKGWRCLVTMEYTFSLGTDGSQVVASMGGEAIDYGDKSTTKAEQMAYKYVLTQVLMVGSGDADADSDSHEIVDRVPLALDPGAWLADAVQIFKQWSPDDRRARYTDAMVQLAVETLTTQKDAKRVFDFMAGVYFEEFPSDETRPF